VKRIAARAGEPSSKIERPDPFRRISDDRLHEETSVYRHRYGTRVNCKTDTRGYATPRNRTKASIVVDSPRGVIPLWREGVVLRWRFQAASVRQFANPDAAMLSMESLLADAILAWGDAVPVTFAKRRTMVDFEIVIERREDCDVSGCTLAAAFFPGAGQQELTLYPTLFEQSRAEQVKTIVHELGHIFGLRHFFANIEEKRWRSEIFGKHSPFSIMNYGSKSKLTKADRMDLKRLYQLAWRKELTSINGTPIRLVKPYSAMRVK
jgi:hypothetical protein